MNFKVSWRAAADPTEVDASQQGLFTWALHEGGADWSSPASDQLR